MNSRPLFEVGEEVILQSKSFPQYNGETTVVSVEYRSGLCVTTGKLLSPNYLYTLGVKSVEVDVWDESALRKKHPPSEHSFTELMEKLKSGEKIEEVV